MYVNTKSIQLIDDNRLSKIFSVFAKIYMINSTKMAPNKPHIETYYQIYQIVDIKNQVIATHYIKMYNNIWKNIDPQNHIKTSLAHKAIT